MSLTSCCRRGLPAALVALAIAVLVPAAAGAAPSASAAASQVRNVIDRSFG